MENESSTGPVIATIIVVVLLVVGGYYLLKKPTVPADGTPSAETATTTPEAQGPADDIESIENDANAIDSNGLDASTTDIEKGL
jgi:hypothetical protein